MKKIVLVVFAVFSYAFSVSAQVVIAPPVVYISSTLPFGTFVVSNASTTPQEVDVSFRFGYPATDSTGRIFMDYKDSTAAQKYSCASWISAFPTKFILKPGQEQVVHMSVPAPDSLKDGAYWTRLVTVSQPQQKFREKVKKGITANIIFMFRQITSVIFEKGNLHTAIDVGRLHTSQDSISVNVLVPIKRTGNAPFLGTSSIRVRNSSGNVVYSGRELIAVYMSFVKDFSIPLSRLPAGDYTADVRLTSDRPDIPAKDRLKIMPVTKSVNFTVK